MTLKVVHIATMHSPHDPRIYHKQCRSLAKAGFDVTLICPRDDRAFAAEDGVNVVLLPKPQSKKERLRITRKLAYQEAMKCKADVYHFHDQELIPIGRKLKSKDNIVIFDIHEDCEAIVKERVFPGPVANVAAKAYLSFINLVTKDLHLCLAEDYYKHQFPRGKCIRNYPILNDEIGNLKNKSPEKVEYNTVKPYHLLYTGNVTPDRGAYNHARLVKLDEDIAVTFIGKCDREIGNQIYSIANGEYGRINIKGFDHYVPWHEVRDAYYDNQWLAGLALFPPTEKYRRKELVKFFEYMYAKIPIICSDFPIWKAFVEKYNCGIAVNPNDNKAVSQALDYLKRNPQRAKEMGLNGYKAITTELSWEMESCKLVSWYRDLLKANKTTS